MSCVKRISIKLWEKNIFKEESMVWRNGRKRFIEVWKRKCSSLNCVWLFVTPWTETHQSPLSMEFSRQEYWSEFPLPSSGGLPYPGIELWSPTLQADCLPSEPPRKPAIDVSLVYNICTHLMYISWWVWTYAYSYDTFQGILKYLINI